MKKHEIKANSFFECYEKLIPVRNDMIFAVFSNISIIFASVSI